MKNFDWRTPQRTVCADYSSTFSQRLLPSHPKEDASPPSSAELYSQTVQLGWDDTVAVKMGDVLSSTEVDGLAVCGVNEPDNEVGSLQSRKQFHR